jgi:hypothetical protein
METTSPPDRRAANEDRRRGDRDRAQQAIARQAHHPSPARAAERAVVEQAEETEDHQHRSHGRGAVAAEAAQPVFSPQAVA